MTQDDFYPLHINGVGRDPDAPGGVLTVYFNRPPTDDEMRGLHDMLRAFLRLDICSMGCAAECQKPRGFKCVAFAASPTPTERMTMTKPANGRRTQLQDSIVLFEKALDDPRANDPGNRNWEAPLIERGARIRFAQGTHECRLHGILATATAGDAAACRAWLAKARAELSAAPGGSSRGA